MKKNYICPKQVCVNLAGESLIANSDTVLFQLDSPTEVSEVELDVKGQTGRKNLWDDVW